MQGQLLLPDVHQALKPRPASLPPNSSPKAPAAWLIRCQVPLTSSAVTTQGCCSRTPGPAPRSYQVPGLDPLPRQLWALHSDGSSPPPPPQFSPPLPTTLHPLANHGHQSSPPPPLPHRQPHRKSESPSQLRHSLTTGPEADTAL